MISIANYANCSEVVRKNRALHYSYLNIKLSSVFIISLTVDCDGECLLLSPLTGCLVGTASVHTAIAITHPSNLQGGGAVGKSLTNIPVLDSNFSSVGEVPVYLHSSFTGATVNLDVPQEGSKGSSIKTIAIETKEVDKICMT